MLITASRRNAATSEQAVHDKFMALSHSEHKGCETTDIGCVDINSMGSKQ